MKTRLYRLAFHWSVTSSLLLITVRYQRVWLQKKNRKYTGEKKKQMKILVYSLSLLNLAWLSLARRILGMSFEEFYHLSTN